jgi:hypothetical protein
MRQHALMKRLITQLEVESFSIRVLKKIPKSWELFFKFHLSVSREL